jgi:hypothetical protein
MTRRLLNLLAAMSLALCLALVVLWVATRGTEAHVTVSVPRLGRYTFCFQYGEFRVFGVAGGVPVAAVAPRAPRG